MTVIDKRNTPESYRFVDVEDLPGGICIVNRHGYIMSRTEMNTRMEQLKRFYEHYTDEGIRLYNISVKEQSAIDLINQPQVYSSDVNSNTKRGYVYLMECQSKYKIGITKNIHTRLKGIQTAHHDDVTLIHCFVSQDTESDELIWHKHFKSKRLKGEWFNLNAEDVEEFCGATQ